MIEFMIAKVLKVAGVEGNFGKVGEIRSIDNYGYNSKNVFDRTFSNESSYKWHTYDMLW